MAIMREGGLNLDSWAFIFSRIGGLFILFVAGNKYMKLGYFLRPL